MAGYAARVARNEQVFYEELLREGAKEAEATVRRPSVRPSVYP